MSKEKRFNCRISAEEHAAVTRRAQDANMTMTDFVTAACLNKRIVIIDDIKPMVSQVRRAGITLNRLEILAREGKIQTVYLDEVQKESADINEKLTEILERKRW